MTQLGAKRWKRLSTPNTRVYVAGPEEVRDALDVVLATLADSPDKWARPKAEGMAGGRCARYCTGRSSSLGPLRVLTSG